MSFTLAELKAMSFNESRDLYKIKKISRFEMLFRDYIHGDIQRPIYTPADVRRIRQELGLSQMGMSLLFGVQDKTILRWERDGENIPGPAQITLCLLDKLKDGFFDLLAPEVERCSLKVNDALQSFFSEPEKSSLSPLSKSVSEEDLSDMPAVFNEQTVRHLRHRLNLSRAQMADLIDVSESAVIKWESGEIQPKGPTLILLKSLWLYGLDALPE